MIEFDFDLYVGGRELSLTVEAEAHIYRDHYGADADGNRGEFRFEMDDLSLIVKDQASRDVTDKIRVGYPKQFKEIEETAMELLLAEFEEDS